MALGQLIVNVRRSVGNIWSVFVSVLIVGHIGCSETSAVNVHPLCCRMSSFGNVGRERLSVVFVGCCSFGNVDREHSSIVFVG